jgi:hypothetical protein
MSFYSGNVDDIETLGDSRVTDPARRARTHISRVRRREEDDNDDRTVHCIQKPFTGHRLECISYGGRRALQRARTEIFSGNRTTRSSKK